MLGTSSRTTRTHSERYPPETNLGCSPETSKRFRNLLLVSGEHPKFVSGGYLSECVRVVRELVPSISLEVGPMEAEQYRPIVEAGAEGLVVYQETYDREVYA